MPRKPLLVEAHFHGEAGAQKANCTEAVRQQRPCRRVGNMDEGKVEAGHHGLRHDMHGIGRQAEHLGACSSQATGDLVEPMAGLIPMTRRLHGGDRGEIHRVHDHRC
ncbi:hypothetical protein D3C87_1438210 [compost metagenome]